MTDLNDQEREALGLLRRLEQAFAARRNCSQTEARQHAKTHGEVVAFLQARAALAACEEPRTREDVSFYVKAGTVCLFGKDLAAKPLPEGMLVVPERELLAAREDTERRQEKRIQELEGVVGACRSALICREALTPLFAEKIRVALRDTEQEPK